ncbi:hypothetical protein EV187_2958 [Agromyces ramosus]|uniref:LPXTG-motif cell wall-anchored protein n=1 Tax=Agromyces ramosus TaxID=33879 RepID=A0A4Q7MA50_9MICO|nr:hypothetical protein [Agromyces ramosus]RZS64571.1 hypothetical protein EV187_2958 [Agromyces ramosus]
MNHRRAAGSLLTLGISAVLTIGAGVLPATADDEVVQSEVIGWVLSPEDAVIQSGESITYTATLVDEAGEPVDPQPAKAPYIGTDAAGDLANGLTITAFSPGPRAVMAVSVVDGVEYFGSTSLTVAGAPVALEITPSATSVDQGGTLTFEVTGVDEWGTPVDGSAATLTSSVATDVIDGLSVTFPTASPHTITAELDGVTASVTVEVIPAASTSATSDSDDPELAATGVDPLLGGTVGGALLLAGLASVLIVRRRSAQS